jgi:hypothetical protein
MDDFNNPKNKNILKIIKKMLQVPFEYHLTPAESEEQRRWEKVQLDKEAQQRNKKNFKISIGNIFKGKNNKTKLKGTNTFADHVKDV